MLRFEKCYPEHLACIMPQDVQSADIADLLSPAGQQVIRASTALSAFYAERCLGAAGVIPQWRGRAVCWAIFGADAGPFMRPIVKKIKTVIRDYPVRRLEMTVLHKHKPGHTLARLLGFEVETECMSYYYPDGSDVTSYVRIRA